MFYFNVLKKVEHYTFHLVIAFLINQRHFNIICDQKEKENSIYLSFYTYDGKLSVAMSKAHTSVDSYLMSNELRACY